MYVGYLFCVRFDVPMHEAIAAFSRQINVLYYFGFMLLFFGQSSTARRQSDIWRDWCECMYILSSLWATHHPTPFTFLLYFSCTGNSLLHFNFLPFSHGQNVLSPASRCSIGLQTSVDAPASTFYHAPGSTGGLDMRFWNKGALVCTSIIHTHHRQQQ